MTILAALSLPAARNKLCGGDLSGEWKRRTQRRDNVTGGNPLNYGLLNSGYNVSKGTEAAAKRNNSSLPRFFIFRRSCVVQTGKG